MKNTFLPTANYYPPTVGQVDLMMRMIKSEADSGGATLVHCGGGKGRAGTVLACWVALYGLGREEKGGVPVMSSQEAVGEVRRLRSGSLETEAQEEFVRRYVSLGWKRAGEGGRLCGEEMEEEGGEVEVDGEVAGVDVLMLCGVQGSGKSSFTRMVKMRTREVVVVSGDEVVAEGGEGNVRSACEGVAGRWRKSPESVEVGKRKVLVVDRCNPTAEERKQWVKLLQGSCRVFAVWFDVDPELCVFRAETRGRHPTIPPWRAKSAITSTAKSLQPPTMQEGIYTGVARVQSTSQFPLFLEPL